MQERFKTPKVTNPKSPWRKRPNTEEPPTHGYKALIEKTRREEEAAAFDAQCKRMREEALAFRKTIKPSPVRVRPGTLPDRVLAC